MDLQEVVWGHGLDRSDSDYEKEAVCCGCGDEPSGSTKCGEFLDYPRTG